MIQYLRFLRRTPAAAPPDLLSYGKLDLSETYRLIVASSLHTGDSKPLAYTLHYAPPEVIRAKERGQSHLVVAEAADVWALGIIAFELLAGVQAFEMCTETGIVECLYGRQPLLWEEAGPDAAVTLSKLGVLKRSVLSCLQRDPSRRPTAGQLRLSWERVFDQQTLTSPSTWA